MYKNNYEASNRDWLGEMEVTGSNLLAVVLHVTIQIGSFRHYK